MISTTIHLTGAPHFLIESFHVPGEKEKETQTPKMKKCFCTKDFKTNEVNIFDDKVICILKRAVCSDEEWKEYEEKVDSEMELSELLEDLGKVLEAANRLKKERKNNITKLRI